MSLVYMTTFMTLDAVDFQSITSYHKGYMRVKGGEVMKLSKILRGRVFITSLVSVAVLVTVIVVLGQHDAHANHSGEDNKATVTKTKLSNSSKSTESSVSSTSSASSSALSEANSSSSDVKSNTDETKFKEQDQKMQLAEMVDYVGYPIFPESNYKVYLKDPDKTIIYDDGEGAGDPFEHATLYQNNHDGTFTIYTGDSVADCSADATADNSYWDKTKTVSASDLMNQQSTKADDLNKIQPKLDFSQQNNDFEFIHINQMTKPNN